MTTQTPYELRSIEQNRKLWASLNDIAKQVEWPAFFGGSFQVEKMQAEDWKDVLSASLERGQRMAAGIEGGYVMLGSRTKHMTVAKMRALIDLIIHFGDSKGVIWTDPKWVALMKLAAEEQARAA